MNRSISLALAVAFCVSAVSAQAAGPKGKFGNRKPVGVVKTNGTNIGVGNGTGNTTNPIANTPPKAGPGFPYNPIGSPERGHGPVVLNPPHHGPINGLPVFPPKPQPTCGWHKCWDHDRYCYRHDHYCYDRMPMISMNCTNNSCSSCLDDGSTVQSADQSSVQTTDQSTDPSADQSTDQSADQTADQSADQTSDQSSDMGE